MLQSYKLQRYIDTLVLPQRERQSNQTKIHEPTKPIQTSASLSLDAHPTSHAFSSNGSAHERLLIRTRYDDDGKTQETFVIPHVF
jgi:hypothetical protein